MKNINSLVAAAVVILAGCGTAPPPQDLDAQALQIIKRSFREQGIAKMDRLERDAAQAACSSDKAPAEDLARRIEAEAQASIQWPSGAQYFGDWREGEKLAQNGRGMTWTDPSAATKDNGGNCYNCHQIDQKEISFGTIGPSLWHYGKLRGVSNLNDPGSAPIIQYTWSKIWNSKANSACSNMPRFGHMKLLDEQQIRHLMSLLLDPASPVNQ